MSDEPGKGEESAEAEDDVFLKKIETSMLSQVALQVRRAFGLGRCVLFAWVCCVILCGRWDVVVVGTWGGSVGREERPGWRRTAGLAAADTVCCKNEHATQTPAHDPAPDTSIPRQEPPSPKHQGIEGIRKVFLREAKRTRLDLEGGQGFVTDNEWVLDTEGEWGGGRSRRAGGG